MKKIIGAILGILVVFTFSFSLFAMDKKADNNKNRTPAKEEVRNYYSYLDYIDMSNVMENKVDFSLAYNPQVPSSIEGVSSNIFIARVISLDKADSPNEKKGGTIGQIYPYTFGKIKILTNLIGEAPKSVSEFIRFGGVMTEKEIYKYDYPMALEKMNSLRLAANLPKVEESEKLIDYRYEDDVYLEAGKVYLIYAKWDNELQKYNALGFQYGSLELMDSEQPIDNMPDSNSNGKGNGKGKAIGKTWKVKNVGNGQEKNLEKYLQEDLNIDIPAQ
jgi:hypothetical protein